MFPNNIENIYNLRKLQQLLFHFCDQDTFFTQYLNHNSDCKQCRGNLVLTLDWNYVFVGDQYAHSLFQQLYPDFSNVLGF